MGEQIKQKTLVKFKNYLLEKFNELVDSTIKDMHVSESDFGEFRLKVQIYTNENDPCVVFVPSATPLYSRDVFRVVDDGTDQESVQS